LQHLIAGLEHDPPGRQYDAGTDVASHCAEHTRFDDLVFASEVSPRHVERCPQHAILEPAVFVPEWKQFAQNGDGARTLHCVFDVLQSVELTEGLAHEEGGRGQHLSHQHFQVVVQLVQRVCGGLVVDKVLCCRNEFSQVPAHLRVGHCDNAVDKQVQVHVGGQG